jgi:hypothetical protein
MKNWPKEDDGALLPWICRWHSTQPLLKKRTFDGSVLGNVPRPS